MSKAANLTKYACGAVPAEGGHLAALRVADWLSLSATPAFATMALTAGVFGAGQPDIICTTTKGAPLSGMVAMYLLMSLFHLSPWLKLASARPWRFTQSAPQTR